jgi:hypothetical protein
MTAYVLEGYTPQRLIDEVQRLVEIYREYGVLVFPKLLADDVEFHRFKTDLSRIFDEVIGRHDQGPRPDDLGEKLVMLAGHKAIDGKIITDLGTQPNKFNTFNRIKYSDYVDRFLRALYGEDAVLMTPQAGDTLHFFPPGEVFHRYNLPAHQDYQYLMQSPEQITFYIGLSAYADGVGGLRIWEKSHKLGVLKSIKNENGAFEIEDYERALQGHASFDYTWNAGDFGIFDSLLAHSSIPNTSTDRGRVVQIFRFSDINNDVARSYDYRSTVYERRGVAFTDVHPDLFSA